MFFTPYELVCYIGLLCCYSLLAASYWLLLFDRTADFHFKLEFLLPDPRISALIRGKLFPISAISAITAITRDLGD